MIPIYKFEESTLYLCEECLDELDHSAVTKLCEECLDDVGPISSKWVESTEASCSICGEEAMDNVYKPYREDNDE